MKVVVSAALADRIQHLLDTEWEISVVEGLPSEPAANEGPGLRPVDVIVCCAAADLVRFGRIFDTLRQHGCVPRAMTGAERDPQRLSESAMVGGEPRLYVVCKTASVDGPQAHRLVEAFARAGTRGRRHQLLVLEIEADRMSAAVSQIRRGADQLRSRLAAAQRARRRAAPRIDTSYAVHSAARRDEVDRIVVDVD